LLNNNKYPFSRLLLCFFILARFFPASAGTDFSKTFLHEAGQLSTEHILQSNNEIVAEEIKQLNKSLISQLTISDFNKCRSVVNILIQKINNNKLTDTVTISESYYYIGVYYYYVSNYYASTKYLNMFIEIKDSNKEYDERYAIALYNLGLASNGLGDFTSQEDYSLKSLDAEKKLKGDTSPDLLKTYISLIIADIELQEYEKSLMYANIALSIAGNNIEEADFSDLSILYTNVGVLYTRLADYSKAKLYLDRASSIYKNQNLPLDVNYVNLVNSLAITYRFLGLTDKSNEFYEQGIVLALSQNSSLAYNIINSYSIILGETGNRTKGEALIADALTRAKTRFGEGSRSYCEVLNNYANYLREYNIDNDKSIKYYLICLDYLNKNDYDIFLKTSVYIGYSLALTEAGMPQKALEIIQLLLFSDYGKDMGTGIYDNPDINTIKADRRTLNVLNTKYRIIWEIYKKSPDQTTLEAASKTSSLIVSLLEIVRINISEEESRLILGDQYRDSYLNTIRDFNLLYSKTADRHFLEKAFEYSEKSKVAGLLTSTRELKAAQFHIPSDIANTERKLQNDISLFNAIIASESALREPDTLLINEWNEDLFESTRVRDSLIHVFEQQYPEYYAIKYNTQVAGLEDIPDILGRNGNYINYIASDTLLYIFVVNRKYQQLLTMTIDSSFYSEIRLFRNLLSTRPHSNDALMEFKKFQSTGFRLYDILINPIRKYLISDKIVISPDNIISYLPFEVLPTFPNSGERILYRALPYLMNEFDISYTYSATFIAETVKRNYSIDNKVILFAPSYPETIDIQSVMMNRQQQTGILHDLPFARQEAEYVSNITGGKLYINREAKESVFKTESSKYDIIHLAMHTVVNDTDPMYSTLIFSPETESDTDTYQDSYLMTYEIYGIPFKAKMVVLSSCNTGTGFLSSGEGILSLARGFIYSGSQSVVMSMWEVEDRSGTEIIKNFYDNLKKGNSKSISLRKSRISYLKKADQLRSHPYFWATLVIYGDNSPLYFSKTFVIVGLLVVLGLFGSIIFYLRKRKYS
jgi:CHAT domain-containing protein/glutaredoxin-related protein